MKKTHGGGTSQNAHMKQFEITMECTAKKAAEILNTNYNTYKEWKSDRRKMTGPSRRLVLVMLAIKGTSIGKKFGV